MPRPGCPTSRRSQAGSRPTWTRRAARGRWITSPGGRPRRLSGRNRATTASRRPLHLHLHRPHRGDAIMSTPANRLQKHYFGDRARPHHLVAGRVEFLAALNGPDEAFRYAKGEPARSSLNNAEENRLSRPLDFAAVTEHAGWLGEYGLIAEPTSPRRTRGPRAGRAVPRGAVPGDDGRAGGRPRHRGGRDLRHRPARSHPARPGSAGKECWKRAGRSGGGWRTSPRAATSRAASPRLERVRGGRPLRAGSTSPGHHLPRQRRAGPAAEQLRGHPPGGAVVLAGDRRGRPGQCRGDHPRRELQQRPDVRPPLQRRPGDRRGLHRGAGRCRSR